MSGTKFVGYILIIIAVLNTVLDLVNGGSFDFQSHYADIVVALNGAGFIRLRKAIDSIGNVFIK